MQFKKGASTVVAVPPSVYDSEWSEHKWSSASGGTCHQQTHDDYDYDYQRDETFNADGTSDVDESETNHVTGTLTGSSSHWWTFTSGSASGGGPWTTSGSDSSSWSASYDENVDYPGFYHGAYYYGSGSGGPYAGYIGDAFGSGSGGGFFSLGGTSGGAFFYSKSADAGDTMMLAEPSQFLTWEATGLPAPGEGPDKHRDTTQLVTMAAAQSPDQKRLEYLIAVLQQMLLVGDALWGGGAAQLAELYPWYTLTNCPTDAPGYTGELYVVNNSGGKFYFPKEWCSLAQVITTMITYYNKTGWFSVDFTWGDQLSHNWPWFPGIALNRKTFNSDVSTALDNALHEVMHNFGWGGFLWSGFGHGHINPLFSTGKNDQTKTVFGRFVTFLQQAQVVSGKSLWDAILEQAAQSVE